MIKQSVPTNKILDGVRYEIRGELAARATELGGRGYVIICLSVGSRGLVG